MNSTHPTPEQLERHRRHAATPAELIVIDGHIAECDRCYGVVKADVNAIALPELHGHPHLTYDAMERWLDGRADATDRELVDGHVAFCEPCLRELADLERARDSILAIDLQEPRARVRWLVAAAAMLVFALVGGWLLFRDDDASRAPVVRTRPTRPPAPVQPPSPDAAQVVTLTRPSILNELVREEGVLRGATDPSVMQLHEPLGTVVLESRPRFRWAPLSGATSYTVAVADAQSDSVAASGSSRTPSWQPDGPLPRGRTYTWQVTAHRGQDRIVAPRPSGPAALFHVATREQAAEIASMLEAGPLARGIALAERGMLDDAERELRLAAREGDARADAILAQVRSWRPSGR